MLFKLGSNNIPPDVHANKTPTIGAVFLLVLSIKAFGKVLYYFPVAIIFLVATQ